jgi:hypothetical protein
MVSIQSNSNLGSLFNSYQTNAKAIASNPSTSNSNSSTYDLNDMTLGQIRTMTDQLAQDGKLTPMQFAILQVSGWMDTDPNNPTPLDAQSGGQTYDVISTLQNAAAYDEEHFNVKGAASYEDLLHTFETFATQESTINTKA